MHQWEFRRAATKLEHSCVAILYFIAPLIQILVEDGVELAVFVVHLAIAETVLMVVLEGKGVLAVSNNVFECWWVEG